jgi:hypothetical protein
VFRFKKTAQCSQMQLGKLSHGYTAPIPQPWLLEKKHAIWMPMAAHVRRQKLDDIHKQLSTGNPLRAYIGDARLQLNCTELQVVGEFAQRLHEGRREAYERGTKDILDALGVKGVTEAKSWGSWGAGLACHFVLPAIKPNYHI